MTSRQAQLVGWIVAGIAFVTGLAGLWLAHLNGTGLQAGTGFMMPFLTFPPIAALVVARRPRNSVGWILLGIPASIAGYAFLGEYATFGLVTRPGSLPVATLASWVRTTMWVPSAALTLVFLPLLFPTGSPLSRRWKPVGWVGALAATTNVVLSQVAAWPFRGLALLDPNEAWVDGTLAEASIAVTFPILLLAGGAAWASLVIRFRRSFGVERLQLKWAIWALGMFIVGLGASSSLPDEGLAAALVPLILVPLVPVSIAIAILRYRLYDIDRIISRTLVYAVLTGLLAMVYGGSVVVLGGVLRSLAGSNDLAVAGSTLVVAAIFSPTRRRIQAFVDRRFYRSRYNAARTVEAFSTRLRDEVDLATLRADLCGVARDTLQPASVSVWLRQGDGTVTRAGATRLA